MFAPLPAWRCGAWAARPMTPATHRTCLPALPAGGPCPAGPGFAGVRPQLCRRIPQERQGLGCPGALCCAVAQHGCAQQGVLRGAACAGMTCLRSVCSQQRHTMPLRRLRHRSTMPAPTIARRATHRRAWARCARSAGAGRAERCPPGFQACRRAALPTVQQDQLGLYSASAAATCSPHCLPSHSAASGQLPGPLRPHPGAGRDAPALRTCAGRLGMCGCARPWHLAIPRVCEAPPLRMASAPLVQLPCCPPPPGGQCELSDAPVRLDRRPSHVPVLLAARQLLPQVNSRRHMGQHSQSCPARHSCQSNCTRLDSVGCEVPRQYPQPLPARADTLFILPCRFQHQARQRAVRV